MQTLRNMPDNARSRADCWRNLQLVVRY
jgi:hypothetical protein